MDDCPMDNHYRRQKQRLDHEFRWNLFSMAVAFASVIVLGLPLTVLINSIVGASSFVAGIIGGAVVFNMVYGLMLWYGIRRETKRNGDA